MTKKLLGSIGVYILAVFVAMLADALLIATIGLVFFGAAGPHIFGLTVAMIFTADN